MDLEGWGDACADLEEWLCDGDEYYQDLLRLEGEYYDDYGTLATEACCACGGGYGPPCDASELLPNAASAGDCGSSLETFKSCENVGISGYACTPSTCYFGVLSPGFCGGKMLPQFLFAKNAILRESLYIQFIKKAL